MEKQETATATVKTDEHTGSKSCTRCDKNDKKGCKNAKAFLVAAAMFIVPLFVFTWLYDSNMGKTHGTFVITGIVVSVAIIVISLVASMIAVEDARTRRCYWYC